jgi:hypothetical protein
MLMIPTPDGEFVAKEPAAHRQHVLTAAISDRSDKIAVQVKGRTAFSVCSAPDRREDEMTHEFIPARSLNTPKVVDN